MSFSRAAPAPGSASSMRAANQRRVVNLLRGGTDVWTQAELARAAGLAPATVSTIVRELARQGLVLSEPGSGRRGSSVRLSPSAGAVAGVVFGHSHLSVALGDLTGRILDQRRREYAADDHVAALAQASDLLGELHGGTVEFRTLALGLPAPIQDDMVSSAAIFPGWEGVNARRVAEERFGVPVHVENDANLGALAEHRLGAGRGYDSSVFIKTSSGVGAGIVIGDELFQGAGGTAGEIGHITLDDQGPACRCGKRGCLEAYTSTPFVQQLLDGQLAGTVDVDTVVAAARGGNVAARRALEEAGMHLGRGVANIVNILNPGLVVIGGDMARAGDLLLDPTRIGLRRYALDPVANTPVVASELGSGASLFGAVLLAAERTELVAAG